MREVSVFGTPVVFSFGGARDGAVAGVACEVDVFAAGVFDGPGGPQGGGTVVEGAGGDVLAGEAGDCGGDGVGGVFGGGGYGGARG